MFFLLSYDDFHSATLRWNCGVAILDTRTPKSPPLQDFKKASPSLMISHWSICLLFPSGYVGMQLVPKTTRNPHQIRRVVLQLGAGSSAWGVWRWTAGKKGQTAGPVLIPPPGSLRGLDTSLRQKQTSRRASVQTGIPWQWYRAKVPWAWWYTYRQVSLFIFFSC